MKFSSLEVLRKKLNNWPPLRRFKVIGNLIFWELISSSKLLVKQVEQVPFPVHGWGKLGLEE